MFENIRISQCLFPWPSKLVFLDLLASSTEEGSLDDLKINKYYIIYKQNTIRNEIFLASLMEYPINGTQKC